MPAKFGGRLANQASFTSKCLKRRPGSALTLPLKFQGPRKAFQPGASLFVFIF
jgi:hypothetical protein